jgi:hypothetical protein
MSRTDAPRVYLDGIWLMRTWSGTVRNVTVLVAVNADGNRLLYLFSASFIVRRMLFGSLSEGSTR